METTNPSEACKKSTEQMFIFYAQWRIHYLHHSFNSDTELLLISLSANFNLFEKFVERVA